MTFIDLLVLVLIVALIVYLARLLIPDAIAQRVVIILICVVAILYVLQHTGLAGSRVLP